VQLQESDLIKAIYSADAKAQTTTGSILTERNVPSAAPYMFKKPEVRLAPYFVVILYIFSL
jgi:hypothetical protein